jgi:hypothetical protein
LSLVAVCGVRVVVRRGGYEGCKGSGLVAWWLGRFVGWLVDVGGRVARLMWVEGGVSLSGDILCCYFFSVMLHAPALRTCHTSTLILASCSKPRMRLLNRVLEIGRNRGVLMSYADWDRGCGGLSTGNSVRSDDTLVSFCGSVRC